MQAYASGIFPMATHRFDPTIHWVAPKMRGVLPLDAVHVPRRLKKTVRRRHFEIRCDTEFAGVVHVVFLVSSGKVTGRRRLHP